MDHSRFSLSTIAVAASLAVSAGAPVSLAAQAAAKPSASREILPFKATERTLPNGLKVIIVPTGFPNIVSLQIPVQTGSRNEFEPGKSGFRALLRAHPCSRGTKTRTQEQMNEIVTKAGARENAYTTDDYTNYYSTFAKEDLEAMLALQADRFQNLDTPKRRSRPKRAQCLANTTRTPRIRATSLRSHARHGLLEAHVQAHDDGLHQGHREHAEPVRVLEGILQALVPAGIHDDNRRR